MTVSRRAATEYVTHPLIAARHSPRAFSPQAVPDAALASLCEAARWAASSLNEQPWQFLIASRTEPAAFARVLGCLVASNQVWAQHAGALIVSVARARLARNDAVNAYAQHDTGMALAHMMLQATALGLAVHPMGGFDGEALRVQCALPEGNSPLVVLAVGYPGDAAALPENLAERERAPRTRKPQQQFVHRGAWGTAFVPEEDAALTSVLDFWFGVLAENGDANAEAQARWWKKDAAFDQQVRGRFGALHAAILSGQHEAWLLSARGSLAYVLTLDQFSRNMFRGAAGMFASDPIALRVATLAIEQGLDRGVPQAMRSFFYLPLMHSEQLAMQERCVELFGDMLEELPESQRAAAAPQLDFANKHRDIVARFGRFPHRNEILNRTSTTEELDFLREPGSSF